MKNSLIALALAAALPFTASAAENLSYNYAEADYAKTDIDAFKADGWGVKGSYGFLPNFHAFGDYSRRKSTTPTSSWTSGRSAPATTLKSPRPPTSLLALPTRSATRSTAGLQRLQR